MQRGCFPITRKSGDLSVCHDICKRFGEAATLFAEPAFEADTGYALKITSAGTGMAVAKGKSGDADCLLAYAKASEGGETPVSVKRAPVYA